MSTDNSSTKELPRLKREDVQGHTSPDDCWVIIGDSVLDVTNFLAEHPGGESILLASAGLDATEDFEDTGHSDEARTMLEEYIVGKVAD